MNSYSKMDKDKAAKLWERIRENVASKVQADLIIGFVYGFIEHIEEAWFDEVGEMNSAAMRSDALRSRFVLAAALGGPNHEGLKYVFGEDGRALMGDVDLDEAAQAIIDTLKGDEDGPKRILDMVSTED